MKTCWITFNAFNAILWLKLIEHSLVISKIIWIPFPHGMPPVQVHISSARSWQIRTFTCKMAGYFTMKTQSFLPTTFAINSVWSAPWFCGFTTESCECLGNSNLKLFKATSSGDSKKIISDVFWWYFLKYISIVIRSEGLSVKVAEVLECDSELSVTFVTTAPLYT